ncbi:MAG TPA: hypothetical protein VF168_14835 [Trueperaceae bacterium]
MPSLRGALLCLCMAAPNLALGQVLPDGVTQIPFTCPARERRQEPVTATNPAEAPDLARRARYREVFPAYVAAVPPEPDAVLLMPLP